MRCEASGSWDREVEDHMGGVNVMVADQLGGKDGIRYAE